MFTSHRIKITFLLFFLLLLSACAQAEPSPTENAVASLPLGEPTPVVVRILNLNLTLAASPTPVLPTPTPLPTLAPPTAAAESAPASETSAATPTCTNAAEFVKNLTIADNTAFKPEQSFAKIWQIKNTGTCVWSTAYSLVYASGESMGSLPSVPLPHDVNPGEQVDLRLNLIAPVTPDTYTGNWYLQDTAGAVFGLGPDSTQPLAITIVVRPLGKPPI
jgi:hypothetical protein